MDKFTITDKGYSVVEVNSFIDNVITQTESMLEKMKKQQRDVLYLQKQIESYKKLENELKTALVRAEHSANASPPMLVIELGILMFVRLVHP